MDEKDEGDDPAGVRPVERADGGVSRAGGEDERLEERLERGASWWAAELAQLCEVVLLLDARVRSHAHLERERGRRKKEAGRAEREAK